MNFYKKYPILCHILIIVAVTIVLVLISFLLMDIYSNHSDTVTVPDAYGLAEQDAAKLFNEANLSYVVIDSIRTDSVARGCVYEQTPAAGSVVKPGRKIYLTINPVAESEVRVPYVIDLSLRQAVSALRNCGLVITDTIYQYNPYKDLVLDIRVDNRRVEFGEKVKVGASVKLYVGDGEASSEITANDSLLSVETDSVVPVDDVILEDTAVED